MRGYNSPLFPFSSGEEGKPLGFSIQTDRKEEETLKRAGSEDGRVGKGKGIAKRTVLLPVLGQLEAIPAEWHWRPRQTLLAKGFRRLDHCGVSIHLDTR